MHQDQVLSRRQVTALFILFVWGTSVIFPPGRAADQNGWVVIILGCFWSLLLIKIYSKLAEFYPDMTIIQMLESVFGKYIGKLLALPFLYYFIFLSSVILRDILDYLRTVFLSDTPDSAISISLLIIMIYIFYKGLNTFANAATGLSKYLILLIITVSILTVSQWEPANLKSTIEFSLNKIVKGFIENSAWPFGEIIAFTMILPAVKPKDFRLGANLGVIITSLVFLIVFFRNNMVMGPHGIENSIYPAEEVLSLIRLGPFRIDITIMTVYLFATVVKLYMCYLAAILVVANIFGVSDYKKLIIPFAGIVYAYSGLVHRDIAETISFGKEIFPYLSFPLSFLMPTILLLVGFLKNKNKSSASDISG